MKINLLFLLFVTLFMQGRLSAQTQSNSSAQLIDVKFLNSIAVKNDVDIATSPKQATPVENKSANDSTILIVLPKVFDPKAMDSKPE
ncbi:MAG: hypothetical protein V4677_18015 [Bacteroidota bacterium]